MNGYQVILSDKLENAYQSIAESLDMSMEQTLTCALQLFIEKLTLEKYPGMADDRKLREAITLAAPSIL